MNTAVKEICDLVHYHYNLLFCKFELEADEDLPTPGSETMETKMAEKQTKYAARLAA